MAAVGAVCEKPMAFRVSSDKKYSKSTSTDGTSRGFLHDENKSAQ